MCKVHKLEEPEKIRNGSKPIYYEIDDNGCYNCVSHRLDRDGYPHCDRNGKEWVMSRYIYTILHGEIQPGMVIKHKLDNPQCINPEHLSMGTQCENMREMINRNRFNKNPRRLSDAQKEEIIKQKNKTIKQLAEEYGVSHATIINIRRKAKMKEKMKRMPDKPSLSSGKQKRKQKKSKV